VADAFTAHLRTYGDRALHDLKLEVRTPRQEPWRIIATLRPFVTQGLTVAANVADEAAARLAARRTLATACPNPLRRAVLATVLASLRFSAKAREDTRFCRSQLYGVSREILWRLGQDLVTAGALDRAEEIVDLQIDEVLGAFEGTGSDVDLRAVAHRRRTEMAAHARKPDLPAYFTLPAGTPLAQALTQHHQSATTPAPGPGRDGTLHGLASSGGTVRARALVVHDPDIPPEQCVDRILVAKETDPGWLGLMMAANGIVVERGSLVSHTAISGRLLGIPTVVAVPGATTAIPDGAWIQIDGDTGTVTLLPDPDPDPDPDAVTE
jgi:pyruvate,water dikinase